MMLITCLHLCNVQDKLQLWWMHSKAQEIGLCALNGRHKIPYLSPVSDPLQVVELQLSGSD